jgi:hypothetical protein
MSVGGRYHGRVTIGRKASDNSPHHFTRRKVGRGDGGGGSGGSGVSVGAGAAGV